MNIRKYFELSYNEIATYQYLWGAAKAMLEGKFIELNTSN